MIKVDNKVFFLGKSKGGINKENQLSSNVQGALKKQIIKVKKLKTAKDIKVKLTGSYKEYEIEVTPKDAPEAAKIMAMLKKKS